MATQTVEQTQADADHQRIDSLEHRIRHLEQLLERMRNSQERETWERRTSRRTS
jgi:uncharacterized protein with WD repeat